MNKIFFVTGEASGDFNASWFVKNKIQTIIPTPSYLEGIGGNELATQGVHIFKPYTELNVVGIFEIIKKIPGLIRFGKKLSQYLAKEQFTHVVLVDFPGFNLRLGKLLKKLYPKIKIIYLAPPQLWCWGAWRLKSLTAIADTIIVLFPFEVAWYKSREVTVLYLGNPVVDRLLPLQKHNTTPKFRLGIFPGSRTQELLTFIPLIQKVIIELTQQFPSLEIAIFQAPGVNIKLLSPLTTMPNTILIPHQERIVAMQTCVTALTKAGTVTLELGIMGIPTTIFYKANWLTYALAKLLVNIKYMGLPNLVTSHELMPEFIQHTCTQKNLCTAVSKILNLWKKDTLGYNQLKKDLAQKLKTVFECS